MPLYVLLVGVMVAVVLATPVGIVANVLVVFLVVVGSDFFLYIRGVPGISEGRACTAHCCIMCRTPAGVGIGAEI